MKKIKLLVVCIFLCLTVFMLAEQAQAARWKFHFTYPQCPGGKLLVWATKDCHRELLLFKGYIPRCRTFTGHVPSGPYNDVIFDFYWDYSCKNQDHIKIVLPNYTGSKWELQELPPWIQANVTDDLRLPNLGDPTGTTPDVYIAVDLQQYLPYAYANPLTIDSFFDITCQINIVDGETPDLPGYLIGTTPIVFDPCAAPTESPLSTTPLTGELYVDAELTIINEEQAYMPKFEQLDVEGPFVPTPNSSWGRVTKDFTEPPGTYYFNLVKGDGGWPVKNMSVESTGERQTLSAFFDLGVQHGSEVSDLAYQYCELDAQPASSAPQGDTTVAPVSGLAYQVGGEEDVTLTALPYLDWPFSFCTVKASGKLPDIDKFVNQPQQRNYCAPGAISNSLKYLQATGGISSTMPTDINDVAAVIGTTSSGTPSSWYLLKQSESYFTDHVTTRYINAPITYADVLDLANELNRGQDIEMDLEGHVEVLAGIRVRCDSNTVDLDLFDDNQVDDQSDPMHTSPLIGTLGSGTQYVDGMVLERFVIECPKLTITIPSIMPYLFLDSWEEWMSALMSGRVRALTQQEGEAYLWQWNLANPEVEVEGEPYPQDPFIPSELYVYEGGSSGEANDPCDAGLVMGWGSADGNSTSAWGLKYDADPDLTNCLITIVVTAPQWSMLTPPGGQINNVSFGIGNPPMGVGPVRSWSWACGAAVTPATPIAWGTPTTLTIDTSKTGMTAATPTATGYTNNAGFNIQNVTWLCVDENGTWIGGANQNMPGPGGFQFLWNYWHWILVTPKTTVDKGIYKKWSQPPVVLDVNDDPPIIQGWDELSNFHNMPVVADDWECNDPRPVTDVHWWGSYFQIDPVTGEHIPWTQPFPPALPRAFHIGIWTDMPVGGDPGADFSHPDLLVWENYCDNFAWNFAGYDLDPRKVFVNPGIPNEPGHDEPMEACFQFTQLLSQEEYFYQEPNEDGTPTVYWLSIAPVWDNDPNWEWGWKTRRPEWNDDGVSIQSATPWWPPIVNVTKWAAGTPIEFPPPPDPESVSWDLAFELTTNEPPEKTTADLHPDGIVNLRDFSILADQWLSGGVGPPPWGP